MKVLLLCLSVFAVYSVDGAAFVPSGPQDYNAFQESIPQDYNAIQESIPQDYDAFQESLPQDYDAFQESLPQDYDASQESIPQDYDAFLQSNPQDYDAFQESKLQDDLDSAADGDASQESLPLQDDFDAFLQSKPQDNNDFDSAADVESQPQDDALLEYQPQDDDSENDAYLESLPVQFMQDDDEDGGVTTQSLMRPKRQEDGYPLSHVQQEDEEPVELSELDDSPMVQTDNAPVSARSFSKNCFVEKKVVGAALSRRASGQRP